MALGATPRPPCATCGHSAEYHWHAYQVGDQVLDSPAWGRCTHQTRRWMSRRYDTCTCVQYVPPQEATPC